MIFKKIKIARTIGNAFFLYSAYNKFDIQKKRHGYPKKLRLEPLFVYSKYALLEQRHQMFGSNSETVLCQLTSKLRNGRFKPNIKGTISNALFLYLANIKFEIYIKKTLIFKKIKIAITIGNAFFLYSANIKFEIHKKKTLILKIL